MVADHLYFERHGAGEPVILLHGGLGSGLEFDRQVPEFAARFQVILIDSRGHGRSPHGPLPLTYELMASDVLAVMDRLGIERASVVGTSDGAITALLLASSHPERLHKVVAYGANMTPDGVHAPAPDSRLEALFDRFAADYRRLAPEPDRYEDLAAELDALYQVAPSFSPAQLRRITAPVLILHGADDEFIAPDQPRRLAELIPGAVLTEIPDAGHFAHIQQPDVFNRIVLAFLEDRNA